MGLVVSTTDIKIDYIVVPADERVANLAGRLDHSSREGEVSNHNGSDRLFLGSGAYPRKSPRVFKGARAQRFEMTFNLQRDANFNKEARIAFNIRDNDDYDHVLIHLYGSSSAPKVYENVDGGQTTYVTQSRSDADMPSVSRNDTLWVRLICDGSSLTVKCLVDNVDAPSEADWTAKAACCTTSDLDFTGGRFGFLDGDKVYVDDVTLTIDQDDNGTYETTEHVEDFEMNANGFAEDKLEHDAAGNLTYDGVFKYRKDPALRLTSSQANYDLQASY
ncbi:MAG: hypothetical protein MI741_23015 [Rhodospirillales bacterium]|nr:hypothetical protein [Rhodospirillales bacterium]